MSTVLTDLADELDNILPKIAFLAAACDAYAALEEKGVSTGFGSPEWSGMGYMLNDLETSLAQIHNVLEKMAYGSA